MRIEWWLRVVDEIVVGLLAFDNFAVIALLDTSVARIDINILSLLGGHIDARTLLEYRCQADTLITQFTHCGGGVAMLASQCVVLGLVLLAETFDSCTGGCKVGCFRWLPTIRDDIWVRAALVQSCACTYMFMICSSLCSSQMYPILLPMTSFRFLTYSLYKLR